MAANLIRISYHDRINVTMSQDQRDNNRPWVARNPELTAILLISAVASGCYIVLLFFAGERNIIDHIASALVGVVFSIIGGTIVTFLSSDKGYLLPRLLQEHAYQTYKSKGFIRRSAAFKLELVRAKDKYTYILKGSITSSIYIFADRITIRGMSLEPLPLNCEQAIKSHHYLNPRGKPNNRVELTSGKPTPFERESGGWLDETAAFEFVYENLNSTSDKHTWDSFVEDFGVTVKASRRLQICSSGS
jgi:hypothetical protein